MIAPALQARTRAAAVEVETRLLRAHLDAEEAQAAQLLQVLPQRASLEPGLGRRVDTYA